MRKISRREFISGTLIIASAGALNGYYLTQKTDASRKKSVPDNQSPGKEIGKVENDISGIGQLYLEINNFSIDAATRKKLLNKLLAVDDIDNYHALFSSFNQQINNRIKEDIKEQQWCTIDGWKLTETECMVSAIAYIEMRIDAGTGTEKTPVNKQQYQNIPFDLPTGNIAEISAWGPKKTSRGQVFNVQPNGNSALWIKVSGLSGPHYVVFFGQYPTHSTVHASGLITADLLPAEALEATQETGTIPIHLVDTRKKIRQKIGIFTVTEGQIGGSGRQYLQCYKQVKTGTLAKVIDWGPKNTKSGQAFNLQADNSSAFWVKVNKVNKGEYTVALGDVVLKTHNHEKEDYVLLTASVEDYVTAAIVHKTQQIPLYIILGKQKQMVGFFTIK